MHARPLLQKTLTNASKNIHLTRQNALIESVETLLAQGCNLVLTELGRTMENTRQPRSNIRKVDRLLGNEHLYEECPVIYQSMAKFVLRGQKRPILLIDWSPTPEPGFQILRATAVCSGRSMLIYEAVYKESMLGKASTHNTFLEQLQSILPARAKPIIITDAGFKNPWFKKIRGLGWDFVGRVRSNPKYRKPGEADWSAIKKLHSKASSSAKRVGQIELTRENTIECECYLYKKKLQCKRKDRKKRSTNRNEIHSKSAREPWVLVTSIEHKNKDSAKKIVKLYSTRMQIEQTFRDLKSARWGFGLEYSRSSGVNRLSILLLIAALAYFVYWLVGIAAEEQSLHYQYQANSIKDKRVLSHIFLGEQIFRRKKHSLKWNDIYNAFKRFSEALINEYQGEMA